MSYEVFISHSTNDKHIANAICSYAEERKIRCWIAPRDILPGVEYAESLVNAIAECSIMVVILSNNSNISRHVRKEVERAVSLGKIIIPFRIEDISLTKSLEYFLSSEHWLDALVPPIEKHIEKLISILLSFLKHVDTSPKDDIHNNPNNLYTPPPETIFEEISPTDWTLGKSNYWISKIRNLFQDK